MHDRFPIVRNSISVGTNFNCILGMLIWLNIFPYNLHILIPVRTGLFMTKAKSMYEFMNYGTIWMMNYSLV